VTDPLNSSDRTALESVVKALEAAWNAGDGARFGAPFAADADFVTIRAEHLRGRDAIAAGHAGIFQTIYAGSVNAFTLDSARLIRPDVALVHVRAVLDVPAGPLAGRHNATYSMILTRTAAGWGIASFHNTLAPPAPAGR
jgi:uncharacterized protein (TIGR02246 family)